MIINFILYSSVAVFDFDRSGGVLDSCMVEGEDGKWGTCAAV